jgi:hypothetical protein
MDSRNYPEGLGANKSRYISGTLVSFGEAKTLRARVTLAQLNAGFTLLPALVGVRWRLLGAMLIAVGGAATTGTSVNLIGTVAAAAVQLVVVTVAALTQSTPIAIGTVAPAAGAVTLLADGASFTQQDANTAITVKTVGAAMTVLTNLDVQLEYAADPA